MSSQLRSYVFQSSNPKNKTTTCCPRWKRTSARDSTRNSSTSSSSSSSSTTHWPRTRNRKTSKQANSNQNCRYRSSNWKSNWKIRPSWGFNLRPSVNYSVKSCRIRAKHMHRLPKWLQSVTSSFSSSRRRSMTKIRSRLESSCRGMISPAKSQSLNPACKHRNLKIRNNRCTFHNWHSN